eukprot:1133796-Rhodomonas_salina.1
MLLPGPSSAPSYVSPPATAIAYDAIVLCDVRYCHTDARRWRSVWCYALCVTELSYGSMRCGTDIVYGAMRCAVLTSRMVLPANRRSRFLRMR